MAIEVRIPTILRTYTDGAKSVEGSGDTLAELLGDLDSRHQGLRDNATDEARQHFQETPKIAMADDAERTRRLHETSPVWSRPIRTEAASGQTEG